MYLFLYHLMFHLIEFPVYQTMDLLMVHPMEQLMELLMYILMDCSMEKNTNPMGMGINNPITIIIMALKHLIINVPHIKMLPCNPTWVKWEEVIMAKAMVFIAINLT